MKQEKLIIGVKYCGHCNPQIDGVSITDEIQKMPEFEIVSCYSRNFELLLIISVCSVNCVTRPSFLGPRIVVAGRHIQEWRLPFGHPGEQILALLRNKGFEVF